ncbi:MAG: M3 family oligoendopeptidase [Anaerolineales bacterium]
MAKTKSKKASKPAKAAKKVRIKPAKNAAKAVKPAKVQAKNLGNVPRWDLSNVYPGLNSDQFEAAVQDLKMQLDEIDSFLQRHKIQKNEAGPAQTSMDELARVLTDLLDKRNAVLRLYFTLNAYSYSFTSTDSFNTEARRIESELEQHGVRLRKHEAAIRAWVGTMGSQLVELIAKPGTLEDHAFYLKETHEQSQYLMSAGEEDLAADLTLSGANAWSKLQNTVTSQLSAEIAVDGKKLRMPMPALINLRNHSDGDTRKRGYEAELEVWEKNKETYAAALNGVKGETNTIDKRRGRKDALHASIDTARIDRQTLDALMEAIHDSFPMFRRYYQAKAKKLGKKQLPWYDVFAPMGKTDTVYTFEQTRDFILEQFGTFSEDLHDLAKRAFDNSWIDAEMRDGKSGGAFCMEVPGVDESRILANFNGSLEQLGTVAHELGHAYHNWCLVGKTFLQAITSLTLAETASIMCETIVTEASLKLANSKAEQLAILENDLQNSSQVIVDIASRFIFEKEVFERRAKAELSADDFCAIMEDAQKQTYGEGLDPQYLHKYMWTWKPHYYRTDLSFYNYPYAFGLLFGTGLYAIYQQRGKEFTTDYRNLLGSTGLGDAATLAARFDINIREKKFWADSLNVVGKRVDQYAKL